MERISSNSPSGPGFVTYTPSPSISGSFTFKIPSPSISPSKLSGIPSLSKSNTPSPSISGSKVFPYNPQLLGSVELQL